MRLPGGAANMLHETMPTTLSHPSGADVGPHRVRLTVRDFYKMGEAGLLDDDRRYELLDGDLIMMPPTGRSPRGRTRLD